MTLREALKLKIGDKVLINNRFFEEYENNSNYKDEISLRGREAIVRAEIEISLSDIVETGLSSYLDVKLSLSDIETIAQTLLDEEDTSLFDVNILVPSYKEYPNTIAYIYELDSYIGGWEDVWLRCD
jgi:bifunctional DNA-binding transcriptional regulator/antitoxin component of YhaV-PrlF toxin-antitoxin module